MRPVSYVSCMNCHADLTKEGKTRKRCAGCHSVFYDDVTCQKKDWAIHKTECSELQCRFIATVQPSYPEVDTMAKLLACPDVCGVIARCYFHGQCGYELNHGLAAFWTTRWLKGGDAEAIFALGYVYMARHAQVVPHKGKEGVELVRRACEMNTLPKDRQIMGQFQLGKCYRLGTGVQVDKLEALKWYRLAAEGGHAEAQIEVGKCYRLGRGVQVNKLEALKWYRLAAEGGHAEAQIEVGITFQSGCGDVKDYVEAMIWYRKAADQGNAEAQALVGLLLLINPEGDLDHDSVEAAKWLRRASEQGNAHAQFSLGTLLVSGHDPTEAVVWFRKSADQGYTGAQYELGTCYHHGNGVAVDHDEAIRLYRLAADKDHDPAKDALLELGK